MPFDFKKQAEELKEYLASLEDENEIDYYSNEINFAIDSTEVLAAT